MDNDELTKGSHYNSDVTTCPRLQSLRRPHINTTHPKTNIPPLKMMIGILHSFQNGPFSEGDLKFFWGLYVPFLVQTRCFLNSTQLNSNNTFPKYHCPRLPADISKVTGPYGPMSTSNDPASGTEKIWVLSQYIHGVDFYPIRILYVGYSR